MKTFNDLTVKEQFEVICSIKYLAEKLDDYIYDCEMDYLKEIIQNLKNIDYSIDICSPSYLEIIGRYGDTDKSDAYEFLQSIISVTADYGCSERCEKQINRCLKLGPDNNLFVYECKKLCEMYFDDNIKPSLDWLANISYWIYSGTYTDVIKDIFECWLENNYDKLENIIWNENEGTWEYIEVIRHKAC